ncbi:PQQ-dependent sugar dehydrogenase [Vibrio sp. CAU 1672]|uniref:PQQ-dependent sugar dehydrogenase n=1 Tax=Vibrio sp. CAU 1672 TaxID=3032594 RepID=UPI0023DCB847|nr:PQQ-dependent sugar dehydrogenase [Vibrio sp. CAU 1672]MDF2153514.1 PQQ-dependent sugar dehydrogenase [Vibrio sp. CAU 1672]
MKVIATALLACISLSAHAVTYHAQLITQGQDVAWGIEFIDHHRLIVNEKQGNIRLIDVTTGASQHLLKVNDVDSRGQGGLLDVALAPGQSPDRQQLYFTYSKSTSSGTTVALASAVLQDSTLSNWQDVFIADAITTTGRHFGSRIAFIDDHLFISIGDRGERDNGQNASNHAAAILRLNLDGSVPEDNPFIKQQGKPEIWSFGHRNPQGLFYDQQTEQLWSVEHGPRGGDEINLIEPGNNYGWARASHGKEYWGPLDVGEAKSLPGMMNPKLVYIPSIAPSNLILYRGDKYPELDGKLIIAALKLTHLNVVTISGRSTLAESNRLLEELGERIRDITTSPDGDIYFSTDSGKIFRLVRNL